MNSIKARHAAYASVSLLALLGASASQAQQYARAPSVEVNLQALQELKARAESQAHFAVSAPPKIETGTIQAKKIYPPGYQPKTPPVSLAKKTPAKQPASALSTARQTTQPPLITPRKTATGYIPPISRASAPVYASHNAVSAPISAPKPQRKTPELNRDYVSSKPVVATANIPVTRLPGNATPNRIPHASFDTPAVTAKAQAPIESASRKSVPPQPSATAKTVLNDMLDMPAKPQRKAAEKQIATYAAPPPIVEALEPAVPRAIASPTLRGVSSPAAKEVAIATVPRVKPVASPVPAKAVPQTGLSDWNPPAVGGDPVVYAKRAPLPPEPKVRRKKLLPAIAPEAPKKKEVTLPENLIDPFKPVESAVPLIKAEQKVARKELFEKKVEETPIPEVSDQLPPETLDVAQSVPADIEIPDLDDVAVAEFDVPDLPAPPVSTLEPEVAKNETPEIANIPNYEAASAPQELPAVADIPLPSFEQEIETASQSALPPLPDFEDAPEIAVASPKAPLPPLDALTQEEDIFDPISAPSKLSAVPSPEEVAELSQEINIPEPKIVEPTRTVAELPDFEVALPELDAPSFDALEFPDIEAAAPDVAPVEQAIVAQEVTKTTPLPLSEISEDIKNGVNELVPEAPDAAFELAALPDLNDIAPTLPEAPEAVPASAQIAFGKGEKTVEQGLEQRIMQVAEEAKSGSKNIQVIAYASGGPEEASSARRISLARALDIRALLIQNGVSEDRISLQALGNRESNSEDRADIFLR